MKAPLLLVMAALVPVFLMSQTVNAATTTNNVSVGPGQTYFVPSNSTIVIDSLNNNGGNVFVMGQLYVNGNLNNTGIIVVTNASRLVVSGTVDNRGSIRSDTGSLLEFDTKALNYGTIDNFGYLAGQGMNFTTYGTLNNHETIESLGITVRVAAGGVYNNYGTYHGTDYSFLRIDKGGTIVNNGTITNGAGDVINDGLLNNTGSIHIHQQTYGVSTMENHAQATINNSANLVIECGVIFNNSGTLSGQPATMIACALPEPIPPAPPTTCDPTQECPSS